MNDPAKTVYNPKGSFYIEALWATLKKMMGSGKAIIVKNESVVKK